MAYLLDKDSLNGEGGKVCRIDNLQVEPAERAEIDLSGIRELTDEIKLLNMRPENPNGNCLSGTMTIPEDNRHAFEEFLKNCEAQAAVQTWRRLKEAKK